MPDETKLNQEDEWMDGWMDVGMLLTRLGTDQNHYLFNQQK